MGGEKGVEGEGGFKTERKVEDRRDCEVEQEIFEGVRGSGC
jgi:hypothetical protein